MGQPHLLGPSGPLRRLIEADRLTSMLLWGPAGTGKTTIAELVATETTSSFVKLSAVSATVKDVRATIEGARERLGGEGRRTILFLDEVHRFNKAQQDALLPAVESGLLTLIGATTETPFFEVNGPLRSRSTLFRLEPLDGPALTELCRRGLEREGAEAASEAVDHLANHAAGDGRQVLMALEVAIALAATDDPPGPVRLGHAEAATTMKALRYGRDEHYDVISAFIKSIRGSDPDAGLYWLARMLAAGEDPRFIARRLIILASEDVGMADPLSLLVADATARAVDYVGLPEARISLAHAVVHLATAPKSNSAYTALGRAMVDVAERPAGEVPLHLRDAHYQGASVLGHGKGYRSPHDEPSGRLEQEYRPEPVSERRYYRPTDRDVHRDGA